MKKGKKKDEGTVGSAGQLRKRAEALFEKRFGKEKIETVSDKEAQRLIHELKTHQIELEIQNEELRNAQLSLEDAKKRYADLYDFAPVGYFTFNRDGLVLEVNLTGASMLRVERRRLIGTTFVLYIKRGDRDSRDYMNVFNAHLRNTLKTGERQRCELELMRKDGTVFFAALESVPSAGERLWTMISNITERKQAEAELVELNKNMVARNVEIEEVNSELESFIYSVSHDLRAPLRHIANFSKILAEDYPDKLDDQGMDYLRRIRRGSERMTLLIDDLLNLSKISRQEIRRAKVDLSRLSRSIVSDLREASPGRNVEVAIAEGLTVFADVRLMVVVLTNLFANAWKFTSKTKNARIELGAAGQDGKTVYYLRDNGAGFNPEYVERIFLPFQRLHADRDFEGSGVGLSIVERIIRRHGGKVWAEGETGKGATIYFTLE